MVTPRDRQNLPMRVGRDITSEVEHRSNIFWTSLHSKSRPVAKLIFHSVCIRMLHNQGEFSFESLWVTIEKSKLFEISWLTSIHSELSNVHAKQNNRCLESWWKNRGKFHTKWNFFKKAWKGKKFFEICLRYFCTIL